MQQFPDVIPAFETREQTAFRWAVDELFEVSRKVYLWTFTVVEVMPSWWMGPTWHELQKWIMKTYGCSQGVRVFEWHRDHGLHVHMLINRRIPVDQLRRFATRLGFGRINVKVCKNVRAGRYLGKYLSKDQGKIPHGSRSFARIGRVGVAVNKIEYRSADLTRRKKVAAGLRKQGMSPWVAMQTANRYAEEEFEAYALASYRWAVPDPF